MAGAITLLGTPTFDTNSGTKTVTATPAVGDYIAIVVANTGNTADLTSLTDNNADGLGTYSSVQAALKNTSADRLGIYVRDAPIGSATPTVFSMVPNGATTGGGLAVIKATGITKVGIAAVRNSAFDDNKAAGTPAPILKGVSGVGAALAALTTNCLVSAVFVSKNPPAITQRTSWSKLFDNGYGSPTAGLEVTSINSGETASTLTWGSAPGTGFCDIAVEFDTSASVAVTVTPTGVAATGSAGTITAKGKANVAPTGVAATGTAGTVAAKGKAVVAPTGVAAAGSAGAITAKGKATVVPTGVSATGSAGTLTESGKARAAPSGVSAAGSAGSVSVSGKARAVPTGVGASGQAGTMTESGKAVISTTGVAATGTAGSVSTRGGAVVTITGTTATGAAGAVSISAGGSVAVPLSGVAAACAAGDLTAVTRVTVAIPDVSGSGHAGTFIVTGVASVPLTGVEAQALAGALVAFAGAASIPVQELAAVDVGERIVTVSIDVRMVTVEPSASMSTTESTEDRMTSIDPDQSTYTVH